MRRLLSAASGMLVILAARGEAQAPRLEVRADVLGPSPYAVQAGIGAILPLGYYARLSLGAADGVRRSNGSWERSSRVDLLARALLDPFRQQRWGTSIGGGLSVRTNLRGDTRAYIAAIVDVEGPAMRGVTPALQVGVSGGLRAGIVIRRAVEGRR